VRIRRDELPHSHSSLQIIAGIVLERCGTPKMHSKAPHQYYTIANLERIAEGMKQIRQMTSLHVVVSIALKVELYLLATSLNGTYSYRAIYVPESSLLVHYGKIRSAAISAGPITPPSCPYLLRSLKVEVLL